MSTTSDVPGPTWRRVIQYAGEASMGVFLMAAVFDWDLWPRWALLAAAWSSIVLGVVGVILGSVLLIFYPEETR